MFKLKVHYGVETIDNFHWSIMIGYGNTYPKFAKKMLVMSGHFIFSPVVKV